MQLHRSICSWRARFESSIENLEAALRTPTIEPSFHNAVKETLRDMPQLLLKAVLNEEATIEMRTVAQAQGQDVTEHRRRDGEDGPEGKCIDREVEGNVEQLGSEELLTLVEEPVDDALPAPYHNPQNEIRSVVYNIVEQVMLDTLREEVFDEPLNPFIVIFFDSDVPFDRLSKNLLTSSSFITPIGTFIRRKIHRTIADKSTVLAKTSKKELVADIVAYGDTIKEMSSWLDLESEKSDRSRPPDIDQKTVIRDVKTATLKDICTRQYRRKKVRIAVRVGIR